jgi:O-antigen/teichoic acid export membrane protein
MINKYKDYFLNLFTSLSYLTSQITILFYFSKHVGLEEVGYYTLSLAITAPLFMLTNFQLKWILATEKPSESTNISRYFHFRFVSSFISLIALLIYISFNADNFKFTLIFLLVLFIKYFESLSDLIYGYLQLRQSFFPILISTFIKSSVTCAFILVDYYFFNDYRYC